MFERFTDRARRVVVLAQEEARLLNHNYIGTEHLLLGLIHEEDGLAAKVLTRLEVSLVAVRAQVEEIAGKGRSAPGGHIPFTPRAKKVLELALREALQLGHNYIGTEHILLGLIREGQGVAAQVLARLGADLSRVRQEVILLLSGYGADVPVGLGPALGQTPAAEKAGALARRLAGSGLVASHHYLLALLDDEASLAAKTLASLGVTPQAVAEYLARADRAGTSDETPEEAGARRLCLVVQADGLRLEIDDPELVAMLATLVHDGRLGSSVRGGEALAASFPELWTVVRAAVVDVGIRARASPEVPGDPAP